MTSRLDPRSPRVTTVIVLLLVATPALAGVPTPASSPQAPLEDPRDASTHPRNASYQLHLEATPNPPHVPPRHTTTFPLNLTVTSPGNVTPPTEVQLRGWDDARGNLTLHPNPLPLEPQRTHYVVQANYTPKEVGPRNLTVHATAPLAANTTWNHTLPVAPDPVTVDITAVGNITPRWRVPVILALNLTTLPRDPANLTLTLRHGTGPDAATWNATPTPLNLTRDPVPVDTGFDAVFGEGAYEVTAHVDGNRSHGTSEPLLVQVQAPEASDATATVHATVTDHPTTLRFNGDSVNEHNRKYPGGTFTTRVIVEDPNGLGTVDDVTFDVARTAPNGSHVPVATRTLPLPADAWQDTSAEVEHTFAWSPLKDGNYTVTVHLQDANTSPIQRTFGVRDQLPQGLGGTLPNATTATPIPPLQGTLHLGDANLGPGPLGPPVSEEGTLTAAVYRWGVGWLDDATVHFPGNTTHLDLSTLDTTGDTVPYAVEGDQGVLHVPFTLHLPQDASEGRYMVGFDHNLDGTTRDLESLNLHLNPPPQVTDLHLEPPQPRPGTDLHVHPVLDGNASTSMRLIHPNGTLLDSTRAPGNATLSVPTGLAPGTELTLEVTPRLPGNRTGPTHTRTLSVAPTPPHLLVGVRWHRAPAPRDPLHVAPSTGGTVDLQVHALDPHGPPVTTSARLLNWHDEVVEDTTCNPAGCSLHLPRELPTGRYTLQVTAHGAGGSTTWNRSVDAGPWLDLRIPHDLTLEPTDDSTLTGTVVVHNAGNVPVPKLHVELPTLHGTQGATWTPQATLTTTPPMDVGWIGQVAHVESGNPLAPGEDLQLHITLPVPPGTPPDTYEGALRVTAPLPEAAP